MKTLVLNSIFLLMALGSFAQKPYVILTVEPEEASVGQIVTVTLKYNVEGQVVENFPSAFIKGYGVNSFFQYKQDLNTGQMIQEHIVILNGQFTKTGTFKVGPFYIKDGNKSVPSNTVSVRVNNGSVLSSDDFSKEQLKKPAFGVIERSAEKIYEGEPLVLNARVYSTFTPTSKPIRKQNYEVGGVVEMYDLLDASNPSAVKIKRKDYYTFTYDRKVMFPTGSGILSIKPFDLLLPYGNNAYSLQSNVPRIEVVPLPSGAPRDFIGAVGTFDVSQEATAKDLKQGDVLTLEVIVSGQGNLHNIDKPRIPLKSGMLIYGDPTVEEDYTFTSAGAVGKVTFIYNIQVTKSGDQTIDPVTISYFDPQQEKYITTKSSDTTTFTVKGDPKYTGPVVTDAETDAHSSTDQLAPLSPYRSPSNKPGLYGSTLFWMGIASPLSLALLLLIVVKRRDENAPVKMQQENVRLTKNNSRTYLSDARSQLQAGQTESFFSNIEKAITTLAVAVAKLDESQVYARQEIIQGLRDQTIAEEDIRQIAALLDQCDYARYGSQGSAEDQERMLQAVQSLMKKLIG